MKRKLPLVVAALLVGVVFDGLFFDKTIGVSAVVFTVVLLASLSFFLRQTRQRPTQDLRLLGLGALAFSSLLFLRASPLLAFLNIAVVAYLLLLMVHEITNKQSWRQLSSQYFFRIVFRTPLAMLTEFFAFFEPDPIPKIATKRGNNSAPIIRGILLSLPILLIFGLLFSSADLVFGHYVSSIFSIFEWNLPATFVAQLIVIGSASGLSLGALALMFRRRKPEPAPTTSGWQQQLGTTEASIILGSVALLFFIFVLIQVTYLFGGVDKVVSGGYTYAEYARRGFFELIIVAIISLGLILILSRATARRSLQHRVLFMWLSGSLVIETFLIMLSASRRLSLYEQAYGFTELRLYSHVFIGWLAILFVLLLVQILREQERSFARYIFLTGLVFVAVLNVLNPDAWIARHNIGRYYQTGKLDIGYLDSLSADATPVIAQQLHSSDLKLQRSINSLLYYQTSRAFGEQSTWQSYNVARERAKSIYRGEAADTPSITKPTGPFQIGPLIDKD